MENNYFTLDENFEEIIRKSVPDKEILNLKFISTGWTNIVYEVETTDGNYFFRFPRDNFWARTIVKDYEFAKYIHDKTDFNTIKLELLYDNGRPFSMHKKVEGAPLAEKMNDLTDAELDNVSDKIAKFMYELHNVDFDKNKIFTIDNIGLDLDDFLKELLEVHVSTEDRAFWYEKNKINTNCLVHGDLNSSNIILDKNNDVAAIIDFGFGGYGNKYDDIARIIGRCPPQFKDRIVKSYEKYSNENLNTATLDENITLWNKIDSGYINYMRKIGIYK